MTKGYCGRGLCLQAFDFHSKPSVAYTWRTNYNFKTQNRKQKNRENVIITRFLRGGDSGIRTHDPLTARETISVKTA